MMKLKQKLFFILWGFSIALSNPGYCQTVTQFTTADGLADNTVFVVFKDQSNNLWFGTQGGLSKYIYQDNRWQNFSASPSGLPNNKINTILQDNSDFYWLATNDGLSHFDGKSTWINFRHSKYPAIIRAEAISALFIDNRGNLWLGTNGGGIARVANPNAIQKWDNFDTGNSGLGSDFITAIHQDDSGAIWIGTQNRGLYRFNTDSTWTAFPDASIGTKINTIFKAEDGSHWFGTEAGAFKLVAPERWQSLGPGTAVRAIAQDSEGNIWFGTETDGLYFYDGITWAKFTHKELQNIPTIWSLCRDQHGHLWLGTNGKGAFRLQLNWQKFNRDENDNSITNFTSITRDSDGGIWVGTAFDGIARLQNRNLDTLRVDGPSYGNNFVKSILIDRKNRLWCGTDNGVHCLINQSEWISYRDSLPNRKIMTIYEDHDGDLWFGTWNGVGQFDGSSWKSWTKKEGLPGQIVISIFQDHNRHMWFGTADGGVCEFADNKVVQIYTKANKLSSNQVNAITQDRDHGYWFGTSNGISRLSSERDKWIYFNTDNSLISHNNIKCLLKDPRDRIWVGTDGGGVCKYDGEFWSRYSVEQLGSDRVNAIFTDPDEIFWFATPNALVKFLPDNSAPNTMILQAPRSPYGIGSALYVFTGTDIETPRENLSYSWALQPAEAISAPLWSTFQKLPYCEVSFPGNGRFQFLVKARDEEGNEDPTPASAGIMVDTTPPKTIITYPANHETISGPVAIIGTAFDSSHIGNDFKRYWLDYARGESITEIRDSDWRPIIPETLTTAAHRDTFFSDRPAINDTLVIWNTSGHHGSYFIRLSAEDTLKHVSDYTIQVTIVAKITEIKSLQGGELSQGQRIQLYIPPGALERDSRIHVSPVTVFRDSLSDTEAVTFSPIAYDLGPEATRLHKPVTLTIAYADSDILNLVETKLALYYLDSTVSNLNRNSFVLSRIYQLPDSLFIGGRVDPSRNTIQTTLDKLGTVILAADDRKRTGELTILDLSCQPRIFSPTGSGFLEITHISFELTDAADITIKIYNLAGRLVREVLDRQKLNPGRISVPWDGKNYHGDVCPSDLYLVTVANGREIKSKTVMILDKSSR